MANDAIESLLEEKIGLDTAAIGRRVIELAVEHRMRQRQVTIPAAYAEILAESGDELRHLIELVVVPETWFFRNRKVFDYLVRFVAKEWLPENTKRPLKVLSVPCSTGEEPYSIAMALLDGGFPKDRFEILGVDISESALKRAKAGVYGQASFRGEDLMYRDRYFQPVDGGYQLLTHVKENVRFRPGNVMESRFSRNPPYDVIFCRNLMIYMSPAARERTLETMSRLLAEKGVFFCGHAERQTAVEWGFEAIDESGVFACRKKCHEHMENKMAGTRETINFHPPSEDKKQQVHERPRKTRASLPLKGEMNAARPGVEPDPAAPLLETMTIETPVDPFAKARSLADRGRLSEALMACEVFLNENPVHAEAHFLMGLIHEALDDDEKAEAFFNRAIYLNPDHAEALNHMAFIKQKRGNRGGAERLRQRAQRISMRGTDSGLTEKKLSGIRNGK